MGPQICGGMGARGRACPQGGGGGGRWWWGGGHAPGGGRSAPRPLSQGDPLKKKKEVIIGGVEDSSAMREKELEIGRRGAFWGVLCAPPSCPCDPLPLPSPALS